MVLLIKSLLFDNRGANSKAVDREGKTPLQRALEVGNTVIDEDILIMLADMSR